MTEKEIQALNDLYGFTYTLSFDGVMEYWKREASKNHPVLKPIAEEVMEQVAQTPELQGAVENPDVLRRHEDVVERIMCGIFSHTFWETDRKGVMAPFGERCFYHTPRFGELFEQFFSQIEHCEVEDLMQIFKYKISNAFFLILHKHYGVEFQGRRHMMHHLTDPETGFRQFFAITINAEFMDVRVKGELPPLTQDDIDSLLLNLDDIDFWAEKLPPKNFEFYGMAVVEMVDVTEDQLFNTIKEDLLEHSALYVPERFEKLEQQFQNLLGATDVHLHIGAFNKDAGVFLKFKRDQATEIIAADDAGLMPFANDFLDAHGIDRMKPHVVSDTSRLEIDGRLRDIFEQEDIKSLMYVPLTLNGEMLGVVIVKSSRVRALTPESWLRFERFVPMLSTVVQRSAEQFEERIRQVIKDNYTALHTAVEWKFNEVALKYIKAKDFDMEKAELEPVVFPGVYPLYGASDIRSSSTLRNEAIRADLLEQLHLAKDTLASILKVKPFPIYHELSFEIDEVVTELSKQLHSQDEEQVLHMLQDKIEPVFRLMSENSPQLVSVVQSYFDALDPKLQILYRRRKAFEASVEMLNRSLIGIIEEEEVRSQVAYPFYFENFKTDGIDYNIYIGDSLSRNVPFDPIYLKNLRLWQMLVTCKVALEGNRMREELPVPLELTHLILAHGTPLDIRFREDENRFDVDGAYNIRYEIMKKRIDKAVIKGGDERITQPGKLAVIYSSAENHDEYMRYFRYISHLGLTSGEVEELDVEDLQGISGLKALRVNLNYAADQQIEQALHKELAEIGEVSLSNR